ASLFDWCNSNQLGISEFVTLGNKSVLNENDFLEYFYKQSQNNPGSEVNPIGLYLESISNGEGFLNITNKISEKDPIFVLKPGKTPAAAQAMQSHTGAIAGEDDVFDAVLEQAGVIRCQTMEDFFDLSRAFAWEKPPSGPKVAIISNAGGPAVISADAVVGSGLELAEFDAQTKEQLLKVLPRSASILNPVDVLGDALAERYAEAAEIILKHDGVHALIVILTPQIMTQIEKTAELIGNLSNKYNKPIFCSFIGGSLVERGEKKLNEYKIPSFRFPERAIWTAGEMWKFRKKQLERETQTESVSTITLDQELEGIRGIIQKAINENYRALDNIAADQVISSVGILTPTTQYIENFDQAKSFAWQNGWPVVLKLSSPGLLHKREIGGVAVDIMNEEQLDDAMHKMERKIDQLDETTKKHVKIQIQKGIQSGVEVLIGLKNDPTFGPILLFGAGGTYAELIADRNLHLLPIDTSTAKKLVEQSKVFALLKGTNTEPPHALEKLYETIVRMGKLATVIPEASEIEINPAIVTLNDVWAVDTKVLMKQPKRKAATPPKLAIAKTLSHILLASKYNHYQFESEQPLDFKPGQYISVKVAPDAIRAYSIATRYGPNISGEGGSGFTKFDLLVDTRPGGPGSKFFENLKAGDTITYLGPFGVFTFNKDDGAENILFLATGSGASAIRCIIDAALLEDNYTKPMYFYFGLTYEEEIFWKDHFDELAGKYPNFKYRIALFKPSDKWEGARGFITELVKKDFPDASKCSAYLCGHRAMISDATDLLIQNGCPKERIYTERFV
ncbi:MAG TPA: acetate--CoA ligase family protein, partial [Patescibacteria group bacterium]|nr:acetate--CoA ligase family protein [Patescibacteria group bacterium]